MNGLTCSLSLRVRESQFVQRWCSFVEDDVRTRRMLVRKGVSPTSRAERETDEERGTTTQTPNNADQRERWS